MVPRSHLGAALARIEALSRTYDLPVANVFHAGDGNLHPLILYNGREPGALERAEELAGEILSMCIELGGSITGEHGVGMEKLAYMPRMFAHRSGRHDRAAPGHRPAELGQPRQDAARQGRPALALRGPHPLEQQGIISRE
ncbi:MAG: FAD-linked oxidase C-terminal domain-containing protein [Caldilineaceae bacterium]